jgi:O-antigen/teichoic acid export membrane protein
MDISNRKMALNTFYNLVGKTVPMLVGLVTIPILIHQMGVERFGVITLVWAVIGYFGVFDLGIGRSTTKFAAEYLILNQLEELRSLVWTSLWLLGALGLLGGFAAYWATPMLVNKILRISPHLVAETSQAFYLLAVSIPFMVSTAGMRGVLEAQQRFGLINSIQVPANLAFFLAPLPLFAFTNKLSIIVVTMVGNRLLVWIVFSYFCLKSLPGMTRPRRPRLAIIKKLLSFGGWLTVSSIISPIITYMDRFLIGALLSMQAVAYYVTPYEIVTKLTIIPQCLVPVLFPAFSAYATDNQNKGAILYQRGTKYVLLLLTPITILVIVLAQPCLTLWLGKEFAHGSTHLLQILAVAFWINSIAYIPFAAIQATGRPDLIAKLLVIELPIHFGVLWLSVHFMGLMGAALVMLLHAMITTPLLLWWTRRLLHLNGQKIINISNFRHLILLIVLLAGLYYPAITPKLWVKIVCLPFLTIGFFIFAWICILDDSEKIKVGLVNVKVQQYFGL